CPKIPPKGRMDTPKFHPDRKPEHPTANVSAHFQTPLRENAYELGSENLGGISPSPRGRIFFEERKRFWSPRRGTRGASTGFGTVVLNQGGCRNALARLFRLPRRSELTRDAAAFAP